MRILLTSFLLFLLLVNSYAQNFEIHMDLAVKAMDDDHFLEAKKEYTNALNYKKHHFAYYMRSLCHVALNQINSAYLDVDTALTLKPNYPTYLEDHASLRFQLGQKSEALEEINRCISLDSTSDFAYSVRAEIYEDAGNYTQALRDIESSLRIEPFSPEYNMKRALLLEKIGDKSSLQEAFLKTFHCSKNEDYFKALVSSSKLRTHGFLDSALVCLNYLIASKGNYAGLLRERGESYLQTKRYKDAIADFTESIAKLKDHRSSYLYSSRGLCYDSLGNTTQALSDYNEAIAWDSTNAKAYLGRGSVYLRQAKPAQALKELNKAMVYNDKIGAAYYFRGIIYLDVYKNTELACEDFVNARRLGYVKSVVAIKENCKKK